MRWVRDVALVSLAYVVCSSWGQLEKRVSERVVGWTPVSPSEFPFIAVVPKTVPRQPCTGVLVNPRVVMVAAACLETLGTEVWLDGLVWHNRSNFSEIHGVERAVSHPYYDNLQPFPNNLGLILLDAPSRIDPIEVNSDPALEEAGVVATVVDWIAQRSELNDSVYLISDLLQRIELPMVDYADCISYWGALDGQNIVRPGMICAGSLNAEKRHCEGGAGPLLVERDGLWIQTGVASYALPDCTQPCLVTVYSQVSAYRCWILETMRYDFKLDVNTSGCGDFMVGPTPESSNIGVNGSEKQCPVTQASPEPVTPIPETMETSSGSTSPSSTPTSDRPPNLSTLGIVGITIGSLVAVIVGVSAAALMVLRCRRMSQNDENQEEERNVDIGDFSYIRSGLAALESHASSVDFLVFPETEFNLTLPSQLRDLSSGTRGSTLPSDAERGNDVGSETHSRIAAAAAKPHSLASNDLVGRS